VGVLLARWLTSLLVALLPQLPMPIALELPIDWRVLGFATVTAIATCLLFGVAPAIRGTRVAPSDVLRGAGRGSTAGRDSTTLRRALVVTQIALSIALVIWDMTWAVNAVMQALNRIHDVEERRSKLRRVAVAVGLGLAVVLCLIVAALVGFGDFFTSSQTALLSEIVPVRERTRSLSYYRFSSDLGSMIGPILLASTMDVVDARAAIVLAAIILGAAAAAAHVFVPARVDTGPASPAPAAA